MSAEPVAQLDPQDLSRGVPYIVVDWKTRPFAHHRFGDQPEWAAGLTAE